MSPDGQPVDVKVTVEREGAVEAALFCQCHERSVGEIHRNVTISLREGADAARSDSGLSYLQVAALSNAPQCLLG